MGVDFCNKLLLYKYIRPSHLQSHRKHNTIMVDYRKIVEIITLVGKCFMHYLSQEFFGSVECNLE